LKQINRIHLHSMTCCR